MGAELEFRVMGTTAHVLVVAGSADAAHAGTERARERLHELEARWSRFVPTSEVSVLNGAGGSPVMVSADTRLLVERAVEGWQRTGGRFDPTVLDAMVALGYDRDFDEIDRATPTPVTTIPAPGCAGIVVDQIVGAVRLPRGVHFDPGGIGKGLAADLVAEELMRAGAHGVCVNVGGDLRVEGESPDGGDWVVDLAHEARLGSRRRPAPPPRRPRDRDVGPLRARRNRGHRRACVVGGGAREGGVRRRPRRRAGVPRAARRGGIPDRRRWRGPYGRHDRSVCGVTVTRST